MCIFLIWKMDDMVEETSYGVKNRENSASIKNGNNIKLKTSVIKQNFFKNKSILKFTLACAVLIGSTSFNNAGYAEVVDINNNTSLENGINNSTYYTNDNTLNITNSINMENSLPTVSNAANLIIQGSETENYTIEGNKLSTIGYTIENSIVNIRNLTFTNFVNPQLSSEANEIYGTALYIADLLTDSTSNITLENVNFIGNSLASTAASETPISLFGGAVANNGNASFTNSNFSNNNVQASGLNNAAGGAVYNSGTLNAVNSNFTDNKAISESGTAQGGAVYNSGTITAENSQFNNNIAQSSDNTAQGGALYNNGSATINGGQFNSNAAQSTNGTAQGGAIYSSGTATIQGTHISGNYAASTNNNAQGGAIYNTGSNFGITDSTLENNNTQTTGTNNANGGAVYNSGTLQTTNSSFTGNTATAVDGSASGGMLYNSGSASITGGNIENNRSETTGSGNAEGGAIYNEGELTISGATLTSNTAQASGSGNAAGGAVFNANSLETTDTTFSSNQAISQDGSAQGGALYNNGTATINGGQFNSNTAQSANGEASGGAVYNSGNTTITGGEINSNTSQATGTGNSEGGAVFNANSLTINNDTQISGNKAVSKDGMANGGAIYSRGTSTITGGEISNNLAESANNNAKGGAIYNESGVFGLTSTELSGNTAQSTVAGDAEGGAAYNAGTLNLTNTTFTQNKTITAEGSSRGGAIYNSGSVQMNGGDLSSNTAQSSGTGNAEGGAIFNSGTSTISDTVISGNTAQANGSGNAYGGAIYNDNGTLYLTNTTFTNNSAVSANGEALGGAIYTTADIVLQGGNTFNGSTTDDLSNDIYFAGGNLIVNNSDNIISSGISSKDNTSSVILQKDSELILDGNNTGFKGNASVGENSTLTYGGNPANSLLNSTIITGANGSVELDFDSNYTLEAGKVTTADNINGNFIKSGTGTLTLTGGDYSDFNGNVVVNSGILSYIQDATTTKYISANSTTINSGATLRYENSASEDTIQNLNGAGTFEKTGNQNLILSGNNAGLTGNTLVNGGSLSYDRNSGASFVGGNVYVNSDAALNYTALTSDSITLNANSKFKFAENSSNASINFVNGNYTLASDLTNIGAGNIISLGNANIALNGTDTTYGGQYSITDSLLDLTDNRISNITFNNLTLSGDNDLTIEFNFATGKFDTITTNNSNAGSIDLTDITFLNTENADNGNLSGEYNVLNGGLTFAQNGSEEIESDIYKYIASYVAGEGTITLERVALLKDTLYILNNERTDDRTFNFVGNDIYYTGQNLGTTNTGILNVIGTGTAANNIISAKTDALAANGLTMFDLSLAETSLNIENITLRDAQSQNAGAVINSTAADAKITINNSIIQNNKSAEGGAIYINDNAESTSELEDVNPSVTITGSSFSNNTATGRAEDIENGITEITGNGGALYIGGSNPEVNISDTTFANNTSENVGGAVFNTAGGNAVVFDNVSFENNTANNENLRGSAIYNLGSMTIKNSTFSGNGSNGTYIYNGARANMTISADNGEKLRLDNGNSEYIYNGGTLNLTTGNGSILNIADLISGGVINARGNITVSDLIRNADMNFTSGTLTLQKDPTLQAAEQRENVFENIDLTASAGTVINLINTNISNGSIDLNVTKNEDGEITLESVLNIESIKSNEPDYEGIKISSDLSGEGTINKTGDGDLVLTGTSNREFIGDLNINEGSVEFLKTTSNTFFGSGSNINVSPDAEFIYHSTDTEENFLGSNFSNITLNGNSTLSVIGNGVGSSKFTLDTGWFTSNGTEANNLVFADAAYTINSIIDRPSESNPDNILDNVRFENSEVSIGSLPGSNSGTYPDTGAKDYDFGSNNYTFSDTELNFSNRVAGDTFNFDNLTFEQSENGSNSGIALDLNLVLDENGEHTPYSDKFVYENGSGIVEITRLYVTDDNGIFNGDGSKGIIQLFEGGTEENHIQVAFADNSQGLGWATNKYVYDVKAATTDFTNDSIEITDGGLSNADTLRDMNVFGADTNGGSRGFSFISDQENGNVYNISRDLGTTTAGTFTVVGDIDADGNKTILSGELTDVITREGDAKLQVNTSGNSITYDGIEIPSEYYSVDNGEYTIRLGEFLEQSNIQSESGETPHGSMFEIVKNTTFEMNNVSVENAVRYKNDTIADGAAVYASDERDQSSIILNNVDLKNNTVENGRGGAIANLQSGSFALYNSIVSGNSASGDGGAVYNSDNMSILRAEFTDNHSGGLGGAIYTDHDILISDTSFSGNTHTNNGVTEANDIYISGADTQVTFVTNSGENSINSGIAGVGEFTKSGEGNLNLTGVNKNFTGNMAIIAGDVNYTADDSNDSFVGGSLELATGSVLNLDIAENAEDQYIQDVSGYVNSNGRSTSGTINKTGAGTIYLNGKNDGFTGRLNINEGDFKYTADESGEMYFGGSTYIASGAGLYLDIKDNIANQTIATVSGSGTFEKTGGGNIDLIGNNSSFTGTANIKDGSVTYVANNTSSRYFTGNTYIGNDGELIADISRRNSEGELIEGQTISNLSDINETNPGGNFTKTGDGTLQLTGDNSGLTGTTTVDQGLLVFTNQETVLDETTGEPTGDILYHNYTGGNTVINDGAELEFTVTGGTDVSSTINGLGGEGLLTKYGESELILTGTNKDFIGDIVIDDGALTYNSTYDPATGEGSFLNANSIEISETSSLNINDKEGEISSLKNVIGSGDINKTGAGKVALNGDNSEFTGILSITDGIISFTNDDGNSYISGNTFVDANGSLDFTTNANTDFTLSQQISGTGLFNKYGTGELILTGANGSFTGDVAINEGDLTYNSSANSDFFNASSIAISKDSSLNLNDRTGETTTLKNLSGEGSLNKTGTGSAILNGDNSQFSGNLDISNGSVSYTNNTGNAYISGNTNINANGILNYTTNQDTNDELTKISGNGKLNKYGDGTLTFTGDNSAFTGNLAITDGIVSYTNNDGNSYIGGNTIISAGGVLDYTTVEGSDNTLTKISGTGDINKNGSGNLTLTGNNSGFSGDLSITEGSVSYTNNSGNSYITGNTIIGKDASLDYTTIDNSNATISNVSGSGTLNKNGEGTLTFSSNNNIDRENFTANINEGQLNVNGVNTDNIDFNINIIGDSILNYTSPASANITLGDSETNRVKFDEAASGATAIFNNGKYVLDGEIANAAGNNITFNDTTLTFANSDTKTSYDSHYSINNSNIDLIGNGINEITFTDLEADNSRLQIDINLDIPGTSTSDKLIVENPNDRPEEITLTEINLSGEHDIGLNETHTINDVVGGDLTLSSQSLTNLYTELYHYTVALSEDKQDMLLTAVSATDNDSLREANQMNGTRGFQFRDTDNPYEISQDLGETAEGKFTVWGDEDKQSEIVLSGGGSKSFFDIVNDTEFVLKDLTIRDAENTKGGSAIFAGNDSATILVDNVDFSSNSSNGNGGAINNTNSESFQITNSSLTENSSSGNGGAIYNNDTMLFTNASLEKLSQNTAGGSGGAVYNTNELNIYNVNISDNSADGNGGALYNSGSMNVINSETAALSGNTAGQSGGAVYNTGEMIISNVNVENNTAGGSGGAIFNTGSLHILTDEITKFTQNTSTEAGGAIYNSGEFSAANAKFTNNSADGSGGVIYNTGTISIADSIFSGNTSKGNGGAIYTNNTIYLTDTDFSGNTDGSGKNDIFVDSKGTANLIAEADTMEISSGLAGNGTVNKTGSQQLILSGSNSRFTGDLNIIDGNLLFTQTDAGDSYILGNTHINSDITLELNTELNNTAAGTFSGAGTLNKTGAYDVSLSGDNSSFVGTTNIEEGSITFNADSNNDKYFGGRTNIQSDGTLNINTVNDMALSNITTDGNLVVNSDKNIYLSRFTGDGSLTKNGSGSLIITGQNRDFTGNLNVNNGVFAMAANASIGNLTNGYFADGTTINLQNTNLINLGDDGFTTNPNPASMEDLYFDTLTLDGNVNFDIDVDLDKQVADKIGAGTVLGSGNLIIDNQSLNVLSDSLFGNTRVEVAYGDITDNILLASDATSVMGPIQKYSVSYEEVLNQTGLNRGNLIFTRQGGTNPDISQVNMSVMASPVATQIGGYLTQLETLNAGFFHMDRYSKYPYMLRLTAEKANVNAINDTPLYQKSMLPETSNAMWIKPYTTFEQVDLQGGIGVSNVSYGALYGGDSDLVDLGNGYKGVLSLFLGYNGNHMSYNGISMNQQGGTIGATGTLYKGNFFTGLTVSTGASAGEAYTAYGTDNFTMLTAGIASKTGYNWEIKEGRIIVQPTLFLGYTFVNTFDYTNAAGVKMDSDPLHAIQIVPGVKVIGNLKNGWQPYLGVNMVWSIMDKTSVMANDVRLPQLSVRPYVEYGVGVQKSWGERFTAFFQTMLRNGGRTGVALTAGFRWTIGKEPQNNSNKPVKKKVIKSL